MNVFDIFKELEKDDTKTFTNGYNTIKSGHDSYELIVKDKDGNEVIILISGWREAVS